MATIIVAPVGQSCNLACEYCYQNEVRDNKKRRMSEFILEVLMKQVFQSFNSEIEFIWHGGEPLLAGLDFYQAMVNFQHQYQSGHKTRNLVQTNSILINSGWIKFFQEHNFSVSVSLDGPSNVHNRHRCFPNSRGSFKQIWKNILKLKKANILGEILVVVTSQTVNYLDDIFDFLVKNEIFRFEISPCFEVNKGQLSGLTILPEQFKYFIELFKRWWNMDNPKIQPRMFWGIVKSLLGGHPLTCAFRQDGCNEFLGVDYNGDLFPCFRFVGYPEMKFGNMVKDDFRKILISPQRKNILQKMINIRQECKQCKWLAYCSGGCPAYAYDLNKDFDASFYFCQLRQQLFTVAQKMLK